MAFREIRAEELSFNPFDKIGKEWMLITAGDEAKHNTMTASWGGLGIMWGQKSPQFISVRSVIQKEFVDQNEAVYNFILQRRVPESAFNLRKQIRSGLREGKKPD